MNLLSHPISFRVHPDGRMERLPDMMSVDVRKLQLLMEADPPLFTPLMDVDRLIREMSGVERSGDEQC